MRHLKTYKLFESIDNIESIDSDRIDIDVKDEIFRLNNFMESFQFSVDSIRYRNRNKSWAKLYDIKPNRWGGRQNFNKIFDVQDWNIENEITDSVEIVMIDNEYRKI